MRIEEEVLSSLRGWGDNPVAIEVGPGITNRAVNAPELLDGITESAHFFQAQGLGPGTIAAMLFNNSIEFVQVFLALCTIGAIPVLLKPEYRKLELEEIFSNSRPSAIVAAKRFINSLRPVIRNQTVITSEGGTLALEGGSGQTCCATDLPAETASLIYTYRGYGYPLAAMVPHSQFYFGAKAFQELTQGLPGQRLLVVLPMSHIFTLVGCVLVPLLNKLTTVISNTLNPIRIFKYIEQFEIDRIIAVPELYFLFLRFLDSSTQIGSLKVLVSGGSLLRASEFEVVRSKFHAELLHGYGLTEFAPVSGHILGKARAGTVGPACRPVDLRIDEGEIQIRSPHLFSGYYRREKETKEAFKDGWFRTGDIGKFDGDHLVFLREQKKTEAW